MCGLSFGHSGDHGTGPCLTRQVHKRSKDRASDCNVVSFIHLLKKD